MLATALGIASLKDAVSSREPSLLFFGNNEEVISRLKFIGHIEKDEKINVKHVFREADTIYTKISRSFIHRDNRQNSLRFIKDVITRAFELLEIHKHRGEYEFCKSIITDLVKARTGIQNLRLTYIEDTKFCCDMDVILETINAKLRMMEEKKDSESKEEKSEKSQEWQDEKKGKNSPSSSPDRSPIFKKRNK